MYKFTKEEKNMKNIDWNYEMQMFKTEEEQ